jgi:hypothetical protein
MATTAPQSVWAQRPPAVGSKTSLPVPIRIFANIIETYDVPVPRDKTYDEGKPLAATKIERECIEHLVGCPPDSGLSPQFGTRSAVAVVSNSEQKLPPSTSTVTSPTAVSPRPSPSSMSPQDSDLTIGSEKVASGHGHYRCGTFSIPSTWLPLNAPPPLHFAEVPMEPMWGNIRLAVDQFAPVWGSMGTESLWKHLVNTAKANGFSNADGSARMKEFASAIKNETLKGDALKKLNDDLRKMAGVDEKDGRNFARLLVPPLTKLRADRNDTVHATAATVTQFEAAMSVAGPGLKPEAATLLKTIGLATKDIVRDSVWRVDDDD